MNKFLFLLPLCAAFIIGFRPTDALTDTGVTRQDIESGTLAHLRYEGDFQFRTNALMRETSRRIPVGTRAATVRGLGTLVRAYVESDAFRKAYRQSVQDFHPVNETYSDEAIAGREAQVAGMSSAVMAQLSAMQQTFAVLDPTMMYSAVKMQVPQLEEQAAASEGGEKQALLLHIAQTKRLLAANAGKPVDFKRHYLAYLQQQMVQNADSQLRQQQSDLAEAKLRNADYHRQQATLDAHSDFRPQLRQRLRAFIALCNSVDFDARLLTAGGRQEFVNPVYRSKSSAWKLLFRMGKEPVWAARDFAQEWLAQLN